MDFAVLVVKVAALEGKHVLDGRIHIDAYLEHLSLVRGHGLRWQHRSAAMLCLWIPAFESVEKRLFAVIPATAGIPKHLKPKDSCRSLPLQAVGRGRNDS
jgi:hypothetical protein